MNIWCILLNCLRRILLNLLKVLQLLLIFLVDILKVLSCDKALEALIFLELAREKGCWGTMSFTIDAQRGLREFLLSIQQECVVDDFLL